MSADPTDWLLYALRESNLLDAGRIAELQSWAGEYHPDTAALSKEVVRRGWLTGYQMREIGKGRAKELQIGPYILLDLLGEGGMGRVFKAHHTRLARDVALKVIRKEKLSKLIVVQRFHQEIRASAQLSHPNVVLAFDADEIDGIHFFAMEFVDGTDLTKVVRDKGPIPFPLACDYIRQAALGLQHAFERGLVHRDIKPSNLLVTPKGQVKVLDLGLALLKEDPGSGGADGHRVTQEGFVLGTPDFLAPEQAQNPQGVDIRADIYGLGATLYYLVSGRVPYEGGTPADKLLKHVTAPPPSLLQVKPDAPPQLDAVIRWMMAKRPADRPQTPVQAAFALVPFCPAPPAVQNPTGPKSGYLPPAMPSYPPSNLPTAPAQAAPVGPHYPPGMPQSQFPQPPLAQSPVPRTVPMPVGNSPATPTSYPQQSGETDFGFAGFDTASSPGRSSRGSDKDGDSPRSRSPRRPAAKPGNPAMVKWIILGVIGIVGLFAICGVGYILLEAVKPETPPPAEFENPAGMKMVLIPAGSFTMGSPENENGRSGDEGPAGQVSISKPFSMSATEVTHEQYVKVMNRSNAKWPGKLRKSGLAPEDNVTWDEANEFCTKLTLMDRNRKSGWAYRLPTEAEWEYACRAKTTGPFWSGDKLVAGKHAIFNLQKDRDEATGYGEEDIKGDYENNLPHPVKSTEKNEFGLYDMHGNVWEWVQDRYASNYDGRASTDPTGPETGDTRVQRGGSWKETAAACRSANRRNMAPNLKSEDVGFRVVYASTK